MTFDIKEETPFSSQRCKYIQTVLLSSPMKNGNGCFTAGKCLNDENFLRLKKVEDDLLGRVNNDEFLQCRTFIIIINFTFSFSPAVNLFHLLIFIYYYSFFTSF